MKKKKRERAILKVYEDEINRHPLLDADQEIALAKRIKQGDQKARNELMLSNLRLVIKIARKYVGKSLNLTLFGLINAGNIGLFRAVEKFDETMGCKLETYATWWIRQSISRALYFDNERFISLDAEHPRLNWDENQNLYDEIACKKAIPPGDSFDNDMLKSVLMEAMSELSPKSQKILSMSFGLKDGILYSDQEIAKELGIKRVENVSMIRRRELKILRKSKKLNKSQ